ncbi:MAG: peroxiredoxin [Gammaproteobacteria bacterium]|nr:peroxiredoxin [Gammaproteobacteria bacterium]
MPIKPGDPIPRVELFELDGDGVPKAVPADEILGGKRIMLFAVPGAFTRTCSAKHLPGFVKHADEIRAFGIDEIACVSVNDAMVMAAWGREHGAGGKIRMLADGLGEFTRALGLEQDMNAKGYGVRSKRYAMLIEDGKVAEIHLESPGEYGVSSAEAALARLGAA